MNESQSDKNDTILITPSLVSEMQSSIKWGRWVSALMLLGAAAGGGLCGFALFKALLYPSSLKAAQFGAYYSVMLILVCIFGLLFMLVAQCGRLLRSYYENLDYFFDSDKMEYYHEALESLAQFWRWAIWTGVCWLLMALLMAFVFVND